MNETAYKLQQRYNKAEKLEQWTDLWFSEYKRAGYVAITDFKKQLFFGAKDVKKVISSTAGKKKQFISLNAFNVNWEEKEYSRKASNLKQIRNIGIDIDQYKLGLTIEEALDSIQALIIENKIPEPNLVLVSRGIQLFYSISHGASPDMTWLVQYITDQFIGKLQHIGADSNAKDMSRVMRVPNSINERNNTVVKPYIWNEETYSLQQLQVYCKPLDKFSRRKNDKSIVIDFNYDPKLLRYYRTNYARMSDLDTLIKLRKGNLTHCRNVFLYIYSFHFALTTDNQTQLINHMKSIFEDVYSTDDKPMSKTYFEDTVKRAYNDARKFFEVYKANGYRMFYKENDGIIKPYKTSNIIDKLGITEEEQYHMKSLRNSDVARKQHNEYMRNKRQQDGTYKQTMEQYNNSRQQQKQAKINELKQLLADNPNATKVELSKELGIGRTHLYNLLRQIK